MSRIRIGLLGLWLVMVGLTAFSVTVAYAEEKSLWLVLNSNGVLKTNLESAVGVEAETPGIMHAVVAGISVLIECKQLAGIGAVITAEGKITGARLKASGCITKLNGSTFPGCEPNAEGKEKGVIKSWPNHALIELSQLSEGVKSEVVRFLPDSGEAFFTVELGEECSIAERFDVFGKVTFKDCQGQALTHLVKHLVEPGSSTELFMIDKSHPATLLGSAWVFLAGAHAGLKFSGDPA